MITIIDYGMGNLGSIKNMLKKIGVNAIITNNISLIKNSTKIILPGVGSFNRAMENIKSLGLFEILNEKAIVDKIPILGICLGMQLLANRSEEGVMLGLGCIEGEVKRFNIDRFLKVPHMGWNTVRQQIPHPLFEGMYENPRFYFVHSYHFQPTSSNDILTYTNYGGEFVSAVCKNNIMGVQFHPEKSHKFGMKLLDNFSKI